MRYFGRRVRNATDVEDLVQDVFVRIAARDSTEPIQHLHGYVLTIASSVMADRARRLSSRRAEAHVPFDPDLHGETDLDAARILGGRQELHAATLALLSLPERTRTVFILRRLEGCRVREIATRLGLSVSAVEKHLVRAVRHLSAEMEKRHA
jgi:RNA polymerase sigma-70 factor (ECF subfamily)